MMTVDSSSSQLSDLSQTLLTSEICNSWLTIGMSKVEMHLSCRQALSFFCNAQRTWELSTYFSRRVSNIQISTRRKRSLPASPSISPPPCGASTTIICRVSLSEVLWWKYSTNARKCRERCHENDTFAFALFLIIVKTVSACSLRYIIQLSHILQISQASRLSSFLPFA